MSDVTIEHAAVDDPVASRASLAARLAVLEQHPRGVIITDARSVILYVNPALSALTGYGSDELVGRTPRVLQSGETPDETYQTLWKTISEGGSWRGELLDQKKGGEFYWADTLIHPVIDSKGRIRYFAGFQEDITARRAAETGGLLETSDVRPERRSLRTLELRVGMVLADDLITSTGVLLVRSGHELDSKLLSRVIRLHQATPLREPLDVWVPMGRAQGEIS